MNSIGQSVFELESGNGNVDGETNGQKRTNQHTELHQFRKRLSYDADLSPCQFWIQLNKAFSSYSPETEMLTDRQTEKKTDTQTDGITPISKAT